MLGTGVGQSGLGHGAVKLCAEKDVPLTPALSP
jgi:hypothetical protein